MAGRPLLPLVVLALLVGAAPPSLATHQCEPEMYVRSHVTAAGWTAWLDTDDSCWPIQGSPAKAAYVYTDEISVQAFAVVAQGAIDLTLHGLGWTGETVSAPWRTATCHLSTGTCVVEFISPRVRVSGAGELTVRAWDDAGRLVIAETYTRVAGG